MKLSGSFPLASIAAVAFQLLILMPLFGVQGLSEPIPEGETSATVAAHDTHCDSQKIAEILHFVADFLGYLSRSADLSCMLNLDRNGSLESDWPGKTSVLYKVTGVQITKYNDPKVTAAGNEVTAHVSLKVSLALTENGTHKIVEQTRGITLSANILPTTEQGDREVIRQIGTGSVATGEETTETDQTRETRSTSAGSIDAVAQKTAKRTKAFFNNVIREIIGRLFFGAGPCE